MLQNPCITNKNQCLCDFYRHPQPYMGYPHFTLSCYSWSPLLRFFKNNKPPSRLHCHMNKGWGILLKMNRVQLQDYRATTRRQFTFCHEIPRDSWYYSWHSMNITSVLMVRWMWGTFEFDRPYKQTKGKK